MSKFYTLKVSDKKLLTPESVSIGLEIPEDLRSKFKFVPGQFVMVEKEIDGKNLRRYYSIYNVPDDKHIQLGIKLKGEDGFAGYAMHGLQVGDTLQVAPPMNDLDFDLQPEKSQKILGITIGSGITPFYSFIKYLIHNLPKTKMVLLYGNENPEKTMFYHELNTLAKQHPGQLKLYHSFSKSDAGDFQGRIDENIIKAVLAKEGTDFDAVYMVGPDDLKKMAAKVLQQAGIPADKLHYRVYS